jgi:hypothetical protein
MLPLYDRAHPNDKPVAYLTQLNFSMGSYLPQEQAREYSSLATA